MASAPDDRPLNTAKTGDWFWDPDGDLTYVNKRPSDDCLDCSYWSIGTNDPQPTTFDPASIEKFYGPGSPITWYMDDAAWSYDVRFIEPSKVVPKPPKPPKFASIEEAEAWLEAHA